MDARELEAAWTDVEASWRDDAAHRRYLERCGDLGGLAEAGRRYRAVLEARPGDPVALRWRDEVVKRATVLGFAQLPRTRPPRQLSPGLRRLLLATLLLLALCASGWIASRLLDLGRAP